MVANGELIDASKLPGFIAIEQNETFGFLTYRIQENHLQIVTINSFSFRKGVGCLLIQKAIQLARNQKLSKIFLFTTNDNIIAHSFYRKLGFICTEIIKDAMINARKLKPEIPLTTSKGIAICDEWKFEKLL